MIANLVRYLASMLPIPQGFRAKVYALTGIKVGSRVIIDRGSGYQGRKHRNRRPGLYMRVRFASRRDNGGAFAPGKTLWDLQE